MSAAKKIVIALLMVFTLSVVVFAEGNNENNDVVNNTSTTPQDFQFLSNQYTQAESDNRVAVNEFIDDTNYEIIGTNNVSNLTILVNKNDLGFIITNNDTGYQWSSQIDSSYLLDENSPLHDEGDLGANNFLIKRMKSPVVITYFVGELRREEGLFDSAGSSFTNIEIINSNNQYGFSSTLRLATANISLKLIVYIDDEGLTVNVPFESIVEHGQMKLSNISLYQFFGATKRDRIPGYSFLPDGIGALIRYDDEIKQIYNKRFFGINLGLGHNALDEPILSANLYGVVHGVNQNGFINIVESGSTYGSLIFNPSRTEDDYNKTYVSFEYRVLFTQYLNSQKTNSVRMVQANKNVFDIELKYQFLSNDNANYVGMANTYRNYLNLENNLVNNNDISLHLNVLAAENKPTLFGNRTFSMTTTEELLDITKQLNDNNINNLDVTYHGWQNKGYSNSNFRYKNINRKIGSKDDLTNLITNINANLYFNVDYTHTNTNTGGFNSKDVNQSLNQELIITNKDQYSLNTNFALNHLQNDYLKMNKLGIENLGFDALTSDLTSNFHSNALSREENLANYQQLIAVSNKSAVASPYSLLWHANVLYDISMYSSNHAKFSDTVPFVPIVLSGSITYGRASNFFSNTQNEVLRMIDYNVYPSFYLTHESSILLLNTKSNHIYTSRFADWKETIIGQYNYVNNALKHVAGSYVTSREVLDVGLVKVVYSNNVSIYINYSANEYQYDGLTISPESYEVML